MPGPFDLIGQMLGASKGGNVPSVTPAFASPALQDAGPNRGMPMDMSLLYNRYAARGKTTQDLQAACQAGDMEACKILESRRRQMNEMQGQGQWGMR